ncbi:YkgJ family cysteine cluster protein [Desulfobulbus sp.]|uniref:YkgJ family cysteine cluster protein n=1 Tax=Desulfobulbus sp. TaxID=895 RepID=UPI00286EF463|nr:YkgJ family cysteine cluster protein [Desulfobulbus sp.]
MDFDHLVPPDRTLIANGTFQFHCHAAVPCYRSCCCNVDILLFPYDVIFLKNRLNISSAEFLQAHTRLCAGSHPFFPGLQLKMLEDERHPCPFLAEAGCSVYTHRPSACRTYPLERAVERPGSGQPLRIHYFLTHHPYCQGHFEERRYSIKQWERDQMLDECNLYNDLWAEVDAFFATNPWAGEGAAGPYQQLAFMVCYNIDDFRSYVENHDLVSRFRLSKEDRRRIGRDDGALLRFGFDWLETILGGRKKLVR